MKLFHPDNRNRSERTARLYAGGSYWHIGRLDTPAERGGS